MKAEDWVLRMKWNPATAQDREAFERWRAMPEHAAAYARAEHLWQSFDRVSAQPGIERMADEILLDAAMRSRRPASRLTWALAASVAFASIAAGGYAWMRNSAPDATYTTQLGERSTVRLDDGSHVVLNSATQLRVTFRPDGRRFRLVRGEAVFQVAEDRQRPFVVAAGDGTVTALGTRFQVRSESQKVIVTLLEGRVAVERDRTGEHMQLKAGEQVDFAQADARMSRRRVDPEVISSWTTGRLQFHSTPLAEVLDEVNRYATVRVRLGDPSLAATPVSGTFEVGDSISLVAALEAAYPIDGTLRNKNELVLQRR